MLRKNGPIIAESPNLVPFLSMSSTRSASKAIIHRLFPRRALSNMADTGVENKHQGVDNEQGRQQAVAVGPVSPNVNRWGKYVFGIYMDQKPPLLGSVRVQRIAELTKEKLKDQKSMSHFSGEVSCCDELTIRDSGV